MVNSLDISSIKLNDEATFEMLSNGKTLGVFQLESSGMKRYMERLKPDCFDLINKSGISISSFSGNKLNIIGSKIYRPAFTKYL